MISLLLSLALAETPVRITEISLAIDGAEFKQPQPSQLIVDSKTSYKGMSVESFEVHRNPDTKGTLDLCKTLKWKEMSELKTTIPGGTRSYCRGPNQVLKVDEKWKCTEAPKPSCQLEYVALFLSDVIKKEKK